ncbi:MAG: PAS domain-containing protein [Vulcanimicrobiaceae bacterium]
MTKNEKICVNYASLFTNSDVAVVLFGADGKAIDGNSSAHALLGYDPTKAAQYSFAEQFCDDDVEAAERAFARALSGKNERIELKMAGVDREPMPVELDVVPANDDAGTIVGVFETARDLRA